MECPPNALSSSVKELTGDELSQTIDAFMKGGFVETGLFGDMIGSSALNQLQRMKESLARDFL